MSVLSNSIEQFIKELMEQSGEVSLQRNELAQHFACAPSQINYVLATRFTLDQGYVIVSKRGGGGYIHVRRLECDGENLLYEYACNQIGGQLPKSKAHAMIERLKGENIINEREGNLLRAAVDACAMPMETQGEGLRARMLRDMLTTLITAIDPCEEE